MILNNEHEGAYIMEQTNYGKKILLATILTGGLALAISQAAIAQPGPNSHHGPNKGMGHSHMQMDPETKKATEKFLADTVKERKELAQKSVEMRTLMNSGTPDTTKASQLAGELFELREKLRIKAQEAGVPWHVVMMNCEGMMPCQGMGYWHNRR